jgi:cyanate permease
MTSTAVTALAARRARIAVVLLFTINGLLPAAWIARLVDIQQDAGLSDASLGLVLASGAAGGLALGLLASPLVARWGSAHVAVAAFVGIAVVRALNGFFQE